MVRKGKRGKGKPEQQWFHDLDLRLTAMHSSIAALARAIGCNPSTLWRWGSKPFSEKFRVSIEAGLARLEQGATQAPKIVNSPFTGPTAQAPVSGNHFRLDGPEVMERFEEQLVVQGEVMARLERLLLRLAADLRKGTTDRGGGPGTRKPDGSDSAHSPEPDEETGT